MITETARRGRPPLPRDERRHRMLTVAVTDAEWALAEEYAARTGTSVSAAIRAALTEAARTA